jgi:hypothetical protein
MEKLQVQFVFEILGRPPEYLKEALNTLIVKLGSEKGVKIMNKTFHEPVQVKDANDLYTTFAEVELELDSLAMFFGILFAYMPAHVEIFSPEKLTLSNSELNEMGNKILMRLHDYDAITKKALADKDLFMKKLYEVAPHLFEKAQEAPKVQEKGRKSRATKSRKPKKSKR